MKRALSLLMDTKITIWIFQLSLTSEAGFIEQVSLTSMRGFELFAYLTTVLHSVKVGVKCCREDESFVGEGEDCALSSWNGK